MWVDTTVATSPALKVWNGTAWVLAVAQVKTGVAAPAGAVNGDLWVDTTGGKAALKVYAGTAWVAIASPDATTAVKGIVQLADAAAITAGTAGRVVDAAQLKAAQAAASGSATAPTAPAAGHVWVDSSVTPAVIKVWSGTAWIPQVGATVTSATAPTAPTAGQVWVDTSAAPNVTKIWDGTKWVTATPDGAATAALANDAKYATKAELATENTWDRTGTSLAPAKVGDVVNISAGTAALPGLTPVGDPNTGVWSPGADQLGISTNGAERLRITSAGKVGIGVTAPTAAGGILQLNGGITFPATQVASTDPNTLDDYEEGTHTATLTPSGSGSITLDTRYQTLTYTKVGRLVSLRGTLIASSSSSPVGYVTVSLPFTPAVVSGIGYAGGSVFVDTATGVNVNEFVMMIIAGGARIYLGDNTVLQSDSAQAIASAGQVYLEMNYHV